MNAKKMVLSLVPWLAFTLVIERGGAATAGTASLLAAALAGYLLFKGRRDGSSAKLIDVAGVATFGVMALVCFGADASVSTWIADYGRGTISLLLAAIMLGSVAVLPFTEQYAREGVPREYWSSPVFRSVNRRISAVWGTAVAVMGGCHLLAGRLDPASGSGANHAAGLALNWVLPPLLALAAVVYTKKATGSAT